MKTQMLRLLAAGALAVSLFAGCGDAGNENNNPDGGTQPTTDAGDNGPDCFENPTTNLEIINSCPPPGTTQQANHVTQRPGCSLRATSVRTLTTGSQATMGLLWPDLSGSISGACAVSRACSARGMRTSTEVSGRSPGLKPMV